MTLPQAKIRQAASPKPTLQRKYPRRTYGPPVRSEDGLGVCELCFHGATDEQIAACEMMIVDPDHLEAKLLAKVEKTSGPHGPTIVAFAVR